MNWRDPHTGIVHAVVPKTELWGATTSSWRKQMECGMDIHIDDRGNIEKYGILITVPWFPVNDPPTCIECLSKAAQKGSDEE